MQRDCALRIVGRGRLTSFSVKYKTGGVGTSGSDRCHLSADKTQDALDRPVIEKHIVRNACVQPTDSSAAIQGQIAPSLGVPVSSRIMRMRLAEGHLGSRCPLHALPLTPTH
ncbi:HTH_Tnp_Tc3_2 domain-containing protein [Trichonephila clavipes]|nr:HTH_Tnp_Tc3_2 domain-containing protein [Trichonephila clavipes]